MKVRRSYNRHFFLSFILLVTSAFACALPFGGEQALYPLRTADGVNYVDRDGDVIIETDYFQAGEFYEGYAGVLPSLEEIEWGFIDRDGEIVIRPQFENVWRFSEGYAAVMEDGAWGAIDEDGRMVIEPQFIWPFEFSDGLAAVTYLKDPEDNLGFRQPGESGFIDTDGEFVIGPLEGTVTGNFADGLAPVNYRPDPAGFIDEHGEMIVELDEDLRTGGGFSEGLAPALDVRRQIDTGECSHGYLDRDGNWVIEPQYCQANPFVEGLALVSTSVDNMQPSFGFINTDGRLVIDDDYIFARDFYHGLAWVMDADNDSGYIDMEGDWVFRDG